MPELLDKSDVMRIINSENAVVLCCTRLRSADEVLFSIASKINSLQTIQTTIEPERNGHWIAVSSFDACGGDEEVWMAHGNPTAYHYCSECKNETYLNEEGKEILSDYCPFCGADMREEGADNG